MPDSVNGRRFGSLVVNAKQDKLDTKRGLVKCVCDCGVTWAMVSIAELQSGWATNCGRNGHRWTYALLAEQVSIVKIGSAESIERRAHDLQQMCPVELVLIGRLARNIEMYLHDRLASKRLHGEWFHYNEAVAAILAEHLEPCRVPLLAGKELGWQKVAKIFGWENHDPTD